MQRRLSSFVFSHDKLAECRPNRQTGMSARHVKWNRFNAAAACGARNCEPHGGVVRKWGGCPFFIMFFPSAFHSLLAQASNHVEGNVQDVFVIAAGCILTLYPNAATSERRSPDRHVDKGFPVNVPVRRPALRGQCQSGCAQRRRGALPPGSLEPFAADDLCAKVASAFWRDETESRQHQHEVAPRKT